MRNQSSTSHRYTERSDLNHFSNTETSQTLLAKITQTLRLLLNAMSARIKHSPELLPLVSLQLIAGFVYAEGQRSHTACVLRRLSGDASSAHPRRYILKNTTTTEKLLLIITHHNILQISFSDSSDVLVKRKLH